MIKMSQSAREKLDSYCKMPPKLMDVASSMSKKGANSVRQEDL